MLLKADKNKIRQKRHLRVRQHLAGTADRPRLNVFRSLAHIYAQIIDDDKGVTLNAFAIPINDFKTQRHIIATANFVGAAIAKKALAAGITEVVFDNNCELGTPAQFAKLLAVAVRQGGLKF